MCAKDTPLGIALKNIRIHSASFECIKWFSILPDRKLLIELGIQTEDAECKLMGDKCNFVIFVLIIESCVGKYHPKTSNQHTGY